MNDQKEIDQFIESAYQEVKKEKVIPALSLMVAQFGMNEIRSKITNVLFIGICIGVLGNLITTMFWYAYEEAVDPTLNQVIAMLLVLLSFFIIFFILIYSKWASSILTKRLAHTIRTKYYDELNKIIDENVKEDIYNGARILIKEEEKTL